MPFQKFSENIAREFLQTVILVDDKAEFIDEIEKLEEIIEEVKEGDALKLTKTKDSETQKNFFDTEGLNAKKIIDSFAEIGMVCSVLKPSKDETELVKRVIKLAHRVDVVVLDWNLNNDNGLTTIQIITDLLKIDSTPRLRLIIIYTGENRSTIVEEVLKELKNKVKTPFDDWQSENGLKFGHTLISIFVKRGIKNDFSIEPHELPNIIIKEFTKIYSGLIPNAALKSISILRENTHNLLGTLKSDLDPPFLSHRALLPEPEDSEQHMIEVIGLEIQSLLQNLNAHSTLNIENINDWLMNFNQIESKKFELKGAEAFTEIKVPNPLTNNIVSGWLRKGLEKSIIPKEIQNKNERNIFNDSCHQNLTNLFCNDYQDASLLDKEFAIITSLKTFYQDQKPKLSLGTIVRENKKKEKAIYWLCVQPKCDCVRIERSRTFLFLKLEKLESNFNVIIKDFDDYVLLKVDYSTFNSMQRRFKANDGIIVAEKDDNNKFNFKISDGGNIYYWVGELRDSFSQRIVNNFGAYMSRVGLDESEWLRRSEKN